MTGEIVVRIFDDDGKVVHIKTDECIELPERVEEVIICTTRQGHKNMEVLKVFNTNPQCTKKRKIYIEVVKGGCGQGYKVHEKPVAGAYMLEVEVAR